MPMKYFKPIGDKIIFSFLTYHSNLLWTSKDNGLKRTRKVISSYIIEIYGSWAKENNLSLRYLKLTQ